MSFRNLQLGLEKMGLLKSVDNVPGIQYYEYRDDTYYGKYEYRMRVKIPYVRYTWWCKSTDELDAKIAGKVKGYGSIKKQDMPDVILHKDALKTIIQLQLDRKKSKDLGLRIESETVAIFSNDLSKLQDIATVLGSSYTPDYTQVQTSQYAGIKHFVDEPKFKYRVYLRSKRIEPGFAKEMLDLIQRLPDLEPSNALLIWLKDASVNTVSWRYRFCSSSYSINYNDESTLSYLALMHGEILGKKYKLEKRPDPA